MQPVLHLRLHIQMAALSRPAFHFVHRLVIGGRNAQFQITERIARIILVPEAEFIATARLQIRQELALDEIRQQMRPRQDPS